ncbi:bifunctional [glutamine synthetase] adenylyltransferase/[glutamine synthetase]-adenylyl-L-tyrosine phosphorylase [Humidisolicoccus flavus]|uniref:bifunctional [glutamine synthetase] adenylyltransferase/[glutamine synthetase]-adenylyl-L-tyrosine phosphorylase n=1 Tax=Humidisolicoccus flavus TaxID=3111414 RepID=UPI003256121C
MARIESARSKLVRLGFFSPSESEAIAQEVAEILGPESLEVFRVAADPDSALALVARMLRSRDEVPAIFRRPESCRALVRVLGASRGLGEVLLQHPEFLSEVEDAKTLPSGSEITAALLKAVGATDGFATVDRPLAIQRFRAEYRRLLIRVATIDLHDDEPWEILPRVAQALSDLADAALEASLAIARSTAAERFPREEVSRTKFAIIAMGKLGAQELNYISDVDVIWVHEADEIEDNRAGQIATLLAKETSLGCMEISREPALWEVDANLRPEGKDGALTRTLPSHLAYYDRWAKSWEFQALLKARAAAGDASLGKRYEESVRSLVWKSSSRDGFVESVQRMRERVTENIARESVERQLKLGPGGLRDIEFTIQLLQLVHGAADAEVQQRATLEALPALADRGYVGRAEASDFAADYKVLRVLEHRVQLVRMQRTHLMPVDDEALRALARSSRLASTSNELRDTWTKVKRRVRTLHERLFYRPLLATVASLPEGGTQLTSEQAAARLSASGFVDAKGALAHIADLTAGVSRRAQIQRLLLPVLLEWLAEGPDPDTGLLAFRRLSATLGGTPWYLRMLRDSALAGERLMTVLSSSKYASNLLEVVPESVRWLDDEDAMRGRSASALDGEVDALVARSAGDSKAFVKGLRAFRRREILRASLASVLMIENVFETGASLTQIARATLRAAVRFEHSSARDGFEFAIITMGRTGGSEIGFGSDVDVMYVCRPLDGESNATQKALSLIARINELTADPRLPFVVDAGLRPEGKNGPMVRTLQSYAAYYERWSLTWESQALLRARPYVGDQALLDDFVELIDRSRYQAEFPQDGIREVRRIKARVEAERLPQGTDRTRHVKLGVGSLSDVEWLVQLFQLVYAARYPALQTTGTVDALHELVNVGLLEPDECETLERSWVLSSRIRNALTLVGARTSDVLPTVREPLELVSRLLGRGPGLATELEEEYLQATRLARRVFEKHFYDSAAVTESE